MTMPSIQELEKSHERSRKKQLSIRELARAELEESATATAPKWQKLRREMEAPVIAKQQRKPARTLPPAAAGAASRVSKRPTSKFPKPRRVPASYSAKLRAEQADREIVALEIESNAREQERVLAEQEEMRQVC
jgi:hypothetical protein